MTVKRLKSPGAGRLKLVAAGLALAGVGIARMLQGIQVVTHWTGQPMFSWALVAAGGICIVFAIIPMSWITNVAGKPSSQDEERGHHALKIVPADATIADLKKNATEYEEQAKKEREPVAGRLREKAQQCRQWVAALKTGRWIS